MDESKDFIAAAKEKAAAEKAELDREIALDRTQGFFARERETAGSFFEGVFLSWLLALAPIIALIGLVIWAFEFSGDSGSAPWVFFSLAGLVLVFVFYRGLKSKNSSSVSLLADMMATFWMGIFPIILFVALAVLGVASWLSIPFQAALALLFVLAIIFFALAHQ